MRTGGRSWLRTPVARRSKRKSKTLKIALF